MCFAKLEIAQTDEDLWKEREMLKKMEKQRQQMHNLARIVIILSQIDLLVKIMSLMTCPALHTHLHCLYLQGCSDRRTLF